MVITKIKLIEKFRNFDKDFSITFKNNVTYIVGENGSGKSTLLELISVKTKHKNLCHFSVEEFSKNIKITTNKKQVETIYFCSKNDLIHSNNLNDTNYDTLFYVSAMMVSSGQCLLMQLSELLNKDLNDKLLILDEPEKGLSLKNQKKLLNFITNLTKKFNNLQIIVVTHSYPIIKNTEEVFSCDKKQYISSKEYLEEIDL